MSRRDPDPTNPYNPFRAAQSARHLLGPETFSGTVVAVEHHVVRSSPEYRPLFRFVLDDGFNTPDSVVDVVYIFRVVAPASLYVATANEVIAAYASAFPERADEMRYQLLGLDEHDAEPDGVLPGPLNESPLAMLQELCGLRFIVDAKLINHPPRALRRPFTRYEWTRDRS